jgi:hypothetical protein
MVLLASLLLFALAGIVAVVGLIVPAWRVAPAELVVASGDPERGKLIIRGSGCMACHVIPGIAGAQHFVNVYEAGDYWLLAVFLWLPISTVIYVGPRWL